MRAPPVYPFLLAAVPVLHTVAENPGVSSATDQVVVVAAALGLTALVYLALRAVLRGPDGRRWAAFLTLLAVVWFFWYRRLAGLVAAVGIEAEHLVAVPLLLGLTAAALVLVRRRPAALDGAARFLTLTGTLLAAFSITNIAADHARSASLLRESTLLRDLARPVAGARQPAVQRDIYVIVMDQYAGSSVLRERFGYDNAPFEDSLRALGFHVPALVRSNYAHTLLSLPSILNAAHLDELEGEVGEEGSDPSIANRLVGRSRVAAFVKSRGYRYVFYPSQWWHATQGSPQADVEPQVWDGVEPARELTRTALRRAVLAGTLLPGRFQQTPVWDADHVQRTLRGVALARRYGRPVFVVAHLLSPHAPFTVDRDCRSPPRRRSYVEQIECLNRRVLALVRELIATSDPAPVIVLQSDHGTKTLGFDDWPSAAQVPAPAARERLAAFGAYYLPAGGAAAFGDTVTAVNVLGNVLRHYFGAELPPEPDAYYLSLDDAPYDFRRVDHAWLTSAGPLPRRLRD